MTCNREIFRHPWVLEEDTYLLSLLFLQKENLGAFFSIENVRDDGKGNIT